MKCVISALFFAIGFGAGSGTKIHASPLISHLTKKSVNGLTLSLTKSRISFERCVAYAHRLNDILVHN